MSTSPKGRYFISYRRIDQRIAEAILVIDALRDRGVPTWRDVDDLGSEPTQDELIRILQDPAIAGAVMLISPKLRLPK